MMLTAEFHNAGGVESAVRALAKAGFDEGSLQVYSSKPVEFRPGVLDRPSRMSLIAVLGAVLNGGLATAFMFWTQLDYPLVTGGMPLTSGWATGVITFELTMAGGIAGTILAFLWEGRFFRKHDPPPGYAMDNDTIFLQLHCPKAEADGATAFLQEAGAARVARRQEGKES